MSRLEAQQQALETPPSTAFSDDEQRAMLRRARVPARLSDPELRAFAQPSLTREALWFAAKFLFWMAVSYLVIVALMLLAGGAR